MKHRVTKDEMFLLKLYEMGKLAGDLSLAVDRFVIGRAIGQNDKGAYVISRDLAQANFVKKGEGDSVYLTAQGLALVERLHQDM